jgi:hypothetical protein
MKAFFALTLAALCQSVYCLRDGTYTIRSASLGPHKVLTENMKEHEEPLAFKEKHERIEPGQLWDLKSKDKGYFEVQNHLGDYINCGTEEGSTCYAGKEPQQFLPERADEDTYELVAKGSGYFLRVAESGELRLAGYDGSPSEKFYLSEV